MQYHFINLCEIDISHIFFSEPFAVITRHRAVIRRTKHGKKTGDPQREVQAVKGPTAARGKKNPWKPHLRWAPAFNVMNYLGE